MQVDWDAGRYETIAAQLAEAARVVVEEAAPASGEHVVDIGCGTGNAALLAASCGARVTGVDPARRLLTVARERAAAQDVEVSFVPGDASNLPVGDASADLALSVFGVIFAPDATAAAAEISRVLGPAGRLFLTAWIPSGPIADVNRLVFQTIARTVGAPPAPPPFPWHDGAALAGLLEPHGFEITVRERQLAFAASSARAFLASQTEDHPLHVLLRAALSTHGASEPELLKSSLALLEAGNEDPGAFRVTSRYVVAAARRPAG